MSKQKLYGKSAYKDARTGITVIVTEYRDDVVACASDRCGNVRRHGSKYCKKCSDKHHAGKNQK